MASLQGSVSSLVLWVTHMYRLNFGMNFRLRKSTRLKSSRSLSRRIVQGVCVFFSLIFVTILAIIISLILVVRYKLENIGLDI